MMKQKPDVEKTVRDIRRHTRKKYAAEEKIRIVLEVLRGEDSIAELCRRTLGWYRYSLEKISMNGVYIEIERRTTMPE